MTFLLLTANSNPETQGYTEDVFPYAEIFSVLICVLILPLWLHILSRGVGEHKPTWRCAVFIVISAWVFETLGAKLGIYGSGTLAVSTVSFLCIEGYMAFCVSFIAGVSGVFIVTGQAVTNIILVCILTSFTSTLGFYMLRNLEGREFLVWVVLIASWGCDTLAYCSGITLGKHHPFPELSPKKSTE